MHMLAFFFFNLNVKVGDEDVDDEVDLHGRRVFVHGYIIIIMETSWIVKSDHREMKNLIYFCKKTLLCDEVSLQYQSQVLHWSMGIETRYLCITIWNCLSIKLYSVTTLQIRF